jgi:integrase
MLVKRGADIFDPDSIKAVIASQKSSNATKAQVIAAYKKFAVINNISWTPPKCEVVRKLPFIPLEKEIDEFIACTGKKMSVILQILKETGARIGEALRLEWTDIDFEKCVISINKPEKHGNARAIKVSEKLMAMLNRLPKDRVNVLGSSLQVVRNNFCAQRKNAAMKLNNPRLLRIHFHTFRHWKATMEYHRTKDILYVMKLLGHKNIANTLIYTQLVEFEEDDKYCSAIAYIVEEAQKLIELGFEYVCNHENVMLFRKRK